MQEVAFTDQWQPKQLIELKAHSNGKQNHAWNSTGALASFVWIVRLWTLEESTNWQYIVPPSFTIFYS